MSTSGGSWLNAVLFVLVIVLAGQLAVVRPGGRSWSPARVAAAAGLWLAVAVPSVLQGWFPALLTSLRRDPDLIRHHGQVWRLVTSVLVQDGGTGGTVFNLVTLGVVAVATVDVWGPGLAGLLFVLAQLVFDVGAVLVSDEVGAGNSGATLGLAASVAGLALVSGLTSVGGPVEGISSTMSTVVRALGVLVAGLVLVGIGDAHGIGVLGGIVIGVVAAVTGHRRADLWQTRGRALG